MAHGTVTDPPKSDTLAQAKPSAQSKLGIFVGILLAAVAVDGALLFVFPNLRGNGMILALTLLTPIIAGTSIALTRSGLRQRTPAAIAWGLRIVLLTVVAADLVLLAAPLFIRGQTAHDSTPQFVGSGGTPTVLAQQATPAPQPTTSPANPGPITFVFNSNTGEGGTTGTAKLGKTADGKTVLNLTDFHTTDGPDLHVFISRVAHPQNNANVTNGSDLGSLNHFTAGTKNFTVPANVDITQIQSIVIYCVSFSAIFGYATVAT